MFRKAYGSLCCVFDEAAAQSSSDMTSTKFSETHTVSASQSLDTRCCALCSLRGDSPSVASVRWCLLTVMLLLCGFFTCCLMVKYCAQFFILLYIQCLKKFAVCHLIASIPKRKLQFLAHHISWVT